MAQFINTSKFNSESHRDGKDCEIVGHYFNPAETSVIDVYAMPQFAIRFTDTGEEYTAYPDEIAEEFWTPEMKAFLKGQSDIGTEADADLKTSEERTAFKFGREVREYKER